MLHRPSIGWRLHNRLLVLSLTLGLLYTGQAQAQRAGFTVVLDAGHGGKDPGAIGNGGKEKDITLGVVLKLGQIIKKRYPEVTVRYTRDKDVFVGLQDRADFANRHKASLFISVHVNSGGGSATGTETYVLGLAKRSNNLSVAMRENKAMLLEKDYKTTYRGFDPSSTESYIMFDVLQDAYLSRSIDFANLVQKQYKRIGRGNRGVRQDILWVLSQSAMPSVLTEIGFISQAGEAAYLLSQSGQEEIAGAIAKAFGSFYTSSKQGSKGINTNHIEEIQEDRTEQEVYSIGQEETQMAEEGVTTANLGKHRTKGNNRNSSKTSNHTIPDNSKYSKQSTARQSKETETRQGSSYRIQFMSSPEAIDPKDKQFARLGHTVRRVKEGRYYIYTVGNTKTLDQARKLRSQVARQYKDCFIVEYNTGKRIGRVH